RPEHRALRPGTQPSDPGTQPSGAASSPAAGGGNGSTGAGPDSLGQQPVEQGAPKDELAETGAADTTFLVLGAATMIAGGIGFRFLPRLTGRGGDAA
ncbi:hypothetical protein GA0115251_13011, partial [Streptomyces sp. TverLS-915]|uniref:LPXTG cell wall anchor domain-containing protein n=1 Tax=Streptomyces sp. TverLS-915 TaxID=1839763 RepID=UPI00081F14F9